MLPFTAASEPVEILVEAVQQKMSQLVMVNFTELLKNAPEVGKTKEADPKEILGGLFVLL